MKKICFTGHRYVKITPKLEARLESTICGLIEKYGAADFYAGGALGWDTLCAQTVLRLRRKYPIRLHLVLPCCEADQTARWSAVQKEIFVKIMSAADSVEYVSQSYFDGCMKLRNQRLVEYADGCVCYYNEKKRASGTGQTVCMAQHKNIVVINLFT
ncbi:MAG: DUF1273 family protein [Oscillospiraceae bacterium]|nr:DUF1273 family protein [Oscillospiraceae bacterium]